MRHVLAFLLCLLPLVARADNWADAHLFDSDGAIGPNRPLPVLLGAGSVGTTSANPIWTQSVGSSPSATSGSTSSGSSTSAAPITGSPTVSSGSLTGAGAVLAAEPNNTTRLHMKVWNFAPAGGPSLYCTDDGSTPSVTNASFIAFAQGGYERDTPAWVPSGVIQCLPSSGTVPYRAESFP